MNLHLLCYHCGLSSFYGDNLLNPIADQSGWHEYSKKWFVKALFEASPIGQITPSPDWTFEPADYINPGCKELTIATADTKRYKARVLYKAD